MTGLLLAQDAAGFARALLRHGYSDLAASVGEAELLNARASAAERVTAAELLLEWTTRESLHGEDAPLQRFCALLGRVADGVHAQDPVEGIRFFCVEAAALRLEGNARLRSAEDFSAVASTRRLAGEEARTLHAAAFALEARLGRLPAAADPRREARKVVLAAELRLLLLGQRVLDCEEGHGLSHSELVARIEGLLLDVPESGSDFRRIYLDGLLLLARTDLASGRVEPAFTAAREVLQLLEVNAGANGTTMGLAERAALVMLAAGFRLTTCATDARRAAVAVLASPAGSSRGELLIAAGDAALLATDDSMASQCFCAALDHEGVRLQALRRILQREDSVLPEARVLKSLAQDALHWPELRAPVLQLLARARRTCVDAAERLRLDRWLAELHLVASDPDSSALHALLAAEALAAAEPAEAKKLFLFAQSLSAVKGTRLRLLADSLAKRFGLDAAAAAPPDVKRSDLADLARRCDAALQARDCALAEGLLNQLRRAGADLEILAAGERRLAELALQLFVAAVPAERERTRQDLILHAQRAIATGTAADFEARLVVQLVVEREVRAARSCLPEAASTASARTAEAAFIACVECAELSLSPVEATHLLVDAARWHGRLGAGTEALFARRQRAEALHAGGILLRDASGFAVTPVQGGVPLAASLWASILAGADPDSAAAWEARWHHLHLMLLSAVDDSSAKARAAKELARLGALTSGRFDEGAWESAFGWLKAKLP